MGINLGPLNIKDSYEGLVQISGSQLTDGSGSLIPNVDVTASNATIAVSSSYAVSSSHSLNSDTAISSSYALTASYAISSSADDLTLQNVTDNGNTTTLPISSSTISVDTYRKYASTGITSALAAQPFLIQAGGGTDLSELILTGDTLQNAAIRIKGSTGVAVSGSALFKDLATFKNGIKVSSSLSPTIEIQSIGGTYDPAINFQRDATYEGGIATTTNNLELYGLAGRNVKVSGSSLEVDLAFTASGLIYPTADGTVGQVVTTDGSGNLTFSTVTATTPDLQEVLDAGNTATGSIDLYNVGFNESVLLTHQTNGGLIKSGRINSVMDIGAGGTNNYISVGGNGAVGFYGLPASNFTNEYSWFPTKGWISGSLAVQQAFTASGLIYPTADGTVGQVLTTDGSGNLTLEDAGGGSPFPYTGSAVITGSIVLTGSMEFADEKVLINQAATVNTTPGHFNVSIGNEGGVVSGNYSTSVGTRSPNVTGVYASTFGGNILGATSNWATAIGGEQNTAGGAYSGIIAGSGNTTSHDRSVILGGTGLTTSKANEVVVSILRADTALTASGLNYPTADGTAGQVIETDGLGNLSFATAGGGGAAFPFSGSAVITGSLLVSGSTTADTVVLQTSVLNGGNEVQKVSLAAYGAGGINASVVNGAIIAAGDSSIAASAAYNGFIAGTDSSNINGGNNTGIVGGFSNTINSDKAFIGGGESNTVSNQSSAAIGGANNTLNGGGSNKIILGGTDSTLTNANSSAMLNCRSSTYNITENNTIINDASSNHSLSPIQYQNVFINNRSTQQDNSGYSYSCGNTIESNVNTYIQNVGQNNISNNYNGRVGKTHGGLILGNYAADTTHLFVSGSDTGGSAPLAFTGRGDQNAVILTGTSRLNTSRRTTLWGTDSITASDLTGSFVMPNVSGSGATYTEDYTLYTEKIHARGAVKGDVGTLTDVAGTTTMDCSLGNFFTLTMPSGGSTILTPTNVQAGQTINVKVTQNATPSLLNFVSIMFAGGTPFTISTGAGEIDVITFVSFDGSSLQATGINNFS